MQEWLDYLWAAWRADDLERPNTLGLIGDSESGEWRVAGG